MHSKSSCIGHVLVREKAKCTKRDKFNANMKWQNIDLNGFVQDIVAYCYISGVFIDGRLSV